jgi:hypothetical protein
MYILAEMTFVDLFVTNERAKHYGAAKPSAFFDLPHA